MSVYRFKPMTPPAAQRIIAWRYEAPYDLYNIVATSDNDIDSEIDYLCDPANRYYSIWESDNDTLIGFCCFGTEGQVPGGDYAAPALDVGIGIDPQHTGHGMGATYIEDVLNFARATFAPQTFRATIAAFNERALRACKRNGLYPVQTFKGKNNQRTYVIVSGEA